MHILNQTKNLLKYLLILSAVLISCQEEFDLSEPLPDGKWEAFTTSNGLPGNNINDIFLDREGTLWVAFNGAGVAKLEGSSWVSYNTTNSDILSNNITCIEQDDDGDMWFGTTNGISFLVDGTSWLYFQDPETQYNILDITADGNGWVWVGTVNNRYFAYDYSYFYFSDLHPDPDFNRVNAIEEDAAGNIWHGTDAGLLKWDWSDWSYQGLINILGTNEVRSLHYDANNRLWIGTSGGMMAAYSKNNTISLVETLNGSYPVYITDIFTDLQGNTWFATWFDGVIRHNGIYSEIFRENNGFPEDDVEAVSPDKDGNIWFGTMSEGLIKYTLPVKTD